MSLRRMGIPTVRSVFERAGLECTYRRTQYEAETIETAAAE